MDPDYSKIVIKLNVTQKVSMWLKMYQCDSKCINVTQNVSIWLKMYQCDSKCISVTQNVSMWLKMYQCDSILLAQINVIQHWSRWPKQIQWLKTKMGKDDSNKLKVMRIYPYDSNLFQFCKSAENYFRLLKTNCQTFKDTKYF